MKNYPEIGEVFELTIDGDAPKNQPLAMAKAYGCSEDWIHKGLTVNGRQTRKFKLVSVGYCDIWCDLTGKLETRGLIPKWQWLEAFRSAYPEPDGQGPIGVADNSCARPGGRTGFPYVSMDGVADICWTSFGFDNIWRWLLEADEPTKDLPAN